jgi:transcriptional regulator GlxA family with amidase domain
MFIEVVRRHLESLAPEETSWFAGLRDPFIGKALSVMHAYPAQDWTLVQLAKHVGLSRSVFAERFTEMIGVPPMQYLAKWRMQLALGLLRTSRSNIATIATVTGYGSEAAFSRAFKKIVGVSPAAWRQRRVHREMSRNLDVIRKESRPSA